MSEYKKDLQRQTKFKLGRSRFPNVRITRKNVVKIMSILNKIKEEEEKQVKKWEKARQESIKRTQKHSNINIKHEEFMKDIYPYLRINDQNIYNTQRFHEVVKAKYNNNIAHSKEFHPSNEVFSLGAYTTEHVLGQYHLNKKYRIFFSTPQIMKAQKYINEQNIDISKYSQQKLFNYLKKIINNNAIE